MNTKELKEVLQLLFKNMKSKSIIESYNSFIFDKNRIIVFNDNYSLEVFFESKIQVRVPAEETLKIISGINDSEITLKVEEGNLQIKGKRVKAAITCFDWDSSILETIEAKSKWLGAADNFNQGIKLCLFSTSADISSAVINSISCHGNIIQSTDNYRVSRFSLSKKMKTFLLPLTSAILLSQLKTKEYSLDENWIHFKNVDGSIMHTRIVEGSFPDTSQLFEIEGPIFHLPEKLHEQIDLVSTLAEGDFVTDKKIKVEIHEGTLRCRAENETGWIESDIELDTAESIAFIINPIFFSEVLKLSSTAVTDGEKIVFESENFEHIMTLFGE